MTASSVQKVGLILALTGCSAIPSTQADLAACIDPISESLNVKLRNGTPTDLIVPSESPQIGCCAVDELSLFVVDREGAELKHCSFLDAFSPMKTQVLRSGEVLNYSLSVLGIQTHYCGIELNNQGLVAVVRAQRGEEVQEVLRASALIHFCSDSTTRDTQKTQSQVP